MKKILLFANTDWYLFNFRIGLARRLSQLGHKVTLVSPNGDYADRLSAEFDWRPLDLCGGSKNPATNLLAVRQVRRLYLEIQPDLVHHFTIKCVLFGGIAARQLGIPAVHAVTGLGHIFTNHNLSNRCVRTIIKPLYRHALAHRKSQVIFQNEENRAFFIKNRLVDSEHTHLIRGSGADCERFTPNNTPRRPGPCRVLFASRLLREKGIFELINAVQDLKQQGVEVELQIAGDIYPGNPSSLSITELESLKQMVTYLGHVDDMRQVFADADIVVLPSYAEGTPRVLLEAGACGKPLIATDIAGCRGVIEPDRNGFLVPLRNVPQLAQAIEVLAKDFDLRTQFGHASRKIIVERFSEVEVINRTLNVYGAAGANIGVPS